VTRSACDMAEDPMTTAARALRAMRALAADLAAARRETAALRRENERLQAENERLRASGRGDPHDLLGPGPREHVR
jgi:hypothetical protein